MTNGEGGMTDAGVALVGCGRMGGAFASGWRGSRAIHAYDPVSAPPEFVERLDDLAAIADLPRPLIVMLAVKPTKLAEVGAELAPHLGGDVLVVSILAGASIASIRAAVGELPVVRTMPNTGVAVGRGVTAACAGNGVEDRHRAACEALFGAVGTFAWVDAEAQMDAVTAVSGSGTAYFFRFAELLAEAGVALGLSEEASMTLARGTLDASGALARTMPETLAQLREQVTSPGGTTAAALAAFNAEDRLAALITEAAAGAKRRAEELGSPAA